MNREMKKNLMKLAGITDEKEFDKLVSQMAPSALEASEKAQKSHSPFQVEKTKNKLTLFTHLH